MPSGECGFGVTSHWPSGPHAFRSMWLCVSRVIGLLVHMTSGACGFVCHESLAFWSTCLLDHVALCVMSHWPSGPHDFWSMWLCVSRVIGLLVHMPSGACGFVCHESLAFWSTCLQEHVALCVMNHWPSGPHDFWSMWLCVS